MKRLIGYTTVILVTLAALVLLWQFHQVLLLFILSLFVAAAVRPLMNRLTTLGLPVSVAQLLVYVLIIGGLIGLLALLGDRLLTEINSMVNRAVVNYDALYHSWLEGNAWQQALADRLPPPLAFSATDTSQLEAMLPTMLGITQGVVTLLAGLFLVLALSIYWSVDQYRFERLWLSLLPAGRRTYARDAWREIEMSLGAYLRNLLAQSVLAALFLSVGGYVMGLDFPLGLALFGALAAFVPLFGGVATAVVAFLVGSLDGLTLAVVAAVYTAVVFLGMGLIVEPRLLQRRRNYLVTILTIIPLVQAFGLMGLIFAPLLAAALEIIIRQYYQAKLIRPVAAVRLSELEQRYQQLQSQMELAVNGESPPELRSLMARLDNLLQQSKKMRI